MFWLNQPQPIFIQPPPPPPPQPQVAVMTISDDRNDAPPPPPSCCCCCNVRIGALIIGFLELIFSGIAALYLIYTMNLSYNGWSDWSSSSTAPTTTTQGWLMGWAQPANQIGWDSGIIWAQSSSAMASTTPGPWMPMMGNHRHYLWLAMFFYGIVMIVASCLIFGITRWRTCLLIPHIICQIFWIILAVIIIIVILATMGSWLGVYTTFFVMLAMYLLISIALQSFSLLIIVQCYGYISMRNQWLQEQMCGGGDTVIIAIDSGPQRAQGYPYGNQVGPRGRRRRGPRQARPQADIYGDTLTDRPSSWTKPAKAPPATAPPPPPPPPPPPAPVPPPAPLEREPTALPDGDLPRLKTAPPDHPELAAPPVTMPESAAGIIDPSLAR